MKRVTLTGDSIRVGYQPFVQEQLQGLAEVWGTQELNGNSAKLRENLDEWVISRKPDLVHINCGLHDIVKRFDATELVVPLPEFEANLRDIFSRLKAAGIPQIIWASITPVNQERHNAVKDFHRFEADLQAYNEVATRVATEFEIPIDDLYAVVTDAGRDALLLADGVHYTAEGSEILGTAVARCISQALKQST